MAESQPPEVLWRGATSREVEILWHGHIWQYVARRNNGVECVGYPRRMTMPRSVFLKARQLAAEAVHNHALRDEMQLRMTDQLTDELVFEDMRVVHAYSRTNNIILTHQNVSGITKSALSDNKSLGWIRAVATGLMAEQQNAATQTKKERRIGEVRAAKRAAELVREPQLPLFDS